MNCAECKELLVGYIEGLLGESEKQAVGSHLERCPPCRAELTELIGLRDRLSANGEALAQSDLENKVLDRIVREQSLRLRNAEKRDRQFQLWRKIMKSRITRFASAAAVIAIAALVVTFMGVSIPEAYALEQTIKANHTVRYLHIKDFDMRHEDEPKEFWFECDEFGQIKNARWHMPEWDAPSDGAKVVVWKEGKAQVWFKKKKGVVTVRDKNAIGQMLKLLEWYDPRRVVERFHLQQREGKVRLEIDEPSDKSEPIVVTGTYLPESPSPGRREVLFVDQATKLVTAIEVYQLTDSEYRYIGAMEFYDYNQRIEPEMFTLDNLPADVVRVDQTTQEVGMAQGELSDEEIAVKVARQFFQALIDRDYAKAGKLIAGVPADWVKQQPFGKAKYLRIVSIGQPAPYPKGGLRVPCKVEIEKDGKIIVQPIVLRVDEIYGQPDRRQIGDVFF